MQHHLKESCIRFYKTSKWIELEGPCCPDLKLFEYASKPDQQGFSSSICLDVMWIQMQLIEFVSFGLYKTAQEIDNHWKVIENWN